MEIGQEEVHESNNRFVNFYRKTKNLILALLIPFIASFIPILWTSEVIFKS
jgi:hypothetical protein